MYPTGTAFPDRLRTFRDLQGLTRADLAESLGVKEITIYRWERGSARPSPLAANRLNELGFGDVSADETNVSSRPRLARRAEAAGRDDAAAIRAESEVEITLSDGRAQALPMSWMRNGPPDQTEFHRHLVALQADGLARFSRPVAAKRLSLIESVEGQGTTAQFQLEAPKATAVAWNSNYGAHGWHRYVGRFPPHVVRALLNYFGAGTSDLVLDPFLGSGTTAVECRLLGIPSIGIEICPLSAMMARVKASFAPDVVAFRTLSKSFQANYQRVLERAAPGGRVLSHDEVMNRPGHAVPHFTNIERWFTPTALLGVSCAVEVAMQENGFAREALLLALSAKMRSIGNVDVDVVRAEYSKTPRENVDVGRLMAQQLKKMGDAIGASMVSHRELIGNADSVSVREGSVLTTDLGSRSVSHIVTSPPYGVEAISYLRTHLLSYRSLVGHLGHDPYDTRDQTIGSEYMEASDARDPKNSRRTSASFREFFSSREQEPKLEKRRIAMMDFFEDMFDVGARFSEWLVDGGKVAFIVGNKRLGERVIPTDRIIVELFESVGLRHVISIQHKLKTNNSNSQVPWQERIIQEESILVFSRCAR
jgi:tRNA G10  N-methylase Trm11/transcriptional regulator with XRE-family HTH domain